MNRRRSQSKSKKQAFGGYTICFEDREETLEEVFGKKQIPPSEMTKRLWKFVKRKRLGKRPK